MMKQARILQFSDMHLFGDRATKFLGLNVRKTFQAVIKHAQKNAPLKPPALVLLTGDLSQDYSQASYQAIAVASRAFSCPVIAILGNHDDEQVFTHILSGTNVDIATKDIVIEGWCILLLNSYWTGKVAGRLDDKELLFLETALTQHANAPTLIFLHHHVLAVKDQWVDNSGLSNAKEFLAVIDRYQQVKAVISGHVHQETSRIRNNVTFLTTPATSWQFAPNTSKFKLDPVMPGYRWIDVGNNDWYSQVERIPFSEEFIPDLNSYGY